MAAMLQNKLDSDDEGAAASEPAKKPRRRKVSTACYCPSK